ncbi:PAS domain S-box protein [Shewanella corallii]|uniref:histidine kinase n=1 Tax=Shewanella corallii TaxID=560080 RepID=A0ABT0N6I1_9GAMM|nr:PAS domain S-box protein [Shewanella corallii]MCL2914033.1 PAS domain S-box protein [Shewanella corallii]
MSLKLKIILAAILLEVAFITLAIVLPASDGPLSTLFITALAAGQLVFVIFAVTLYSRNVQFRLKELRDGLEKISQTGPGQQLTITRHDELSEVEQALNRMSKTLELDQEKLQENLVKQKDTNNKLQEERIKQKAILDASLDGIISINEQEHIVEFNQVAERIFGYTKEEVLNRPMTDFIMPDQYKEPHKAGFARFLESGKSVVLDQRLTLSAKRRNGETFPMEFCISAVHTHEGYMFIAHVRDVSEQHKAETELKLAAHAFSSSDAMFISDLNYKVIRCNQAFLDMTQLEEGTILGQHVRHVACRSNDKATLRSIWIKLWEKGRWKGEVQIKRGDASFPALATVSAVQGPNYKATHYVFHLIDISKQKQYEAILEQAKIDAERASVSKSRFLASMSHEIRTPINGVLGLLTMLEDTGLSDDQREVVNTAKTSGNMLLSIINDVLDFSRMESGNLLLDNHAFNLPQNLQQTAELLTPFANRKDVQLDIRLAEDLPEWVSGDPDRLAQILMNITNNAIKFTQEGAVTLSATSQRGESDRLMLVCRIRDTGIGIAPELLPHLFDEFTMADQSYSRSKEGTGLGLAISARLVKLMGGEIEVQSEQGVGSCFTIIIPLTECQPATEPGSLIEQPKPVDAQAGSELTAPKNSDMSEPDQKTMVMVVEDNLANCMVVKHQLLKAGFDFVIVNDGFTALELLHTHKEQGDSEQLPRRPDVVLMDISMPGMDGMTTTQKLRKMPSPYGDLPVIALTAHALAGDKEKFLDAGMNDYIAKPTNRETLAKHIEALLQGQDSSSDSAGIGNTDDWIDTEALRQLADDIGAEVLPELLTLYIQDSNQRLRVFETALLEGDFQILEFEGHTLGSSAAAHGCASLCQAMRRVERACQENDLDQASELASSALEISIHSFNALEQWLTQLRIKLNGPSAASAG